MNYNLNDLAAVWHINGRFDQTISIKWLLTDSRSLSFPQESLFFALKTDRNDGHRYIEDLYKKGVRAFVVSKQFDSNNQFPQAVFFQVENPLLALQSLSVHHRNQYNGTVIGITGSNGKTIVKEWLWQLLKDDVHMVRSPRSYNSQIGVPLSVVLLDSKTELAIFEAGISMPGEMHRLGKMIQPSIGILTNILESHQENFTSKDAKALEKIQLFESCSQIVYCADQSISEALLKAHFVENKLFGWSRKHSNAPLYVEVLSESNFRSLIRYHYLGVQHSFILPFNDEPSIENSLHCLAILLLRQVPAPVIAQRMGQLEPVAMRLEVKEGKHGCIIINDSYNADINALDLALDFQERRTKDVHGNSIMNRTLILSDILQSGKRTEDLYRAVSQMVKRRGLNRFIGVGHQLSAFASLFPDHAQFFLQTDRLLNSGLLEQLKNESILIKGSRTFGFEHISSRLSLKIHETVLEVNLDALVHNVNCFRSKLKPETQLICMVKAAGYGSGALEVAKTLQANSVDVLAVAVADEGVELRQAGIHLPILVMNPEFGSFATIFEHKLEPEIYSFKLLDAFILEAEKEGVRDYPIHLKLDTGMHRLGFEAHQIETLLGRLKGQESLRVRSVFSHLAGADEEQFDAFTNLQIDLFEKLAERIQQAFDHRILKHILNSSGIERFSQHQHDMVRLGIGMYGISSIEEQNLKNVSTLRTTILQIKDLEAGESVGYGRKGQLFRKSRIATLPIGYADGLDRHLGNGMGEVLIHGKRASIIGNVCMDACMVDVTDIDAAEGDEAILFGEGLPLSEVAAKLGTIPYEILTSVSNRVKRIYFQE